MPSVTIIGAGPAGAAAALMLARNSWSVRIVEAHDFPRHKVCGECLSSLGIEVVDRLGLRGQMETAGANRIEGASVSAADGSVLRVELPCAMWGVSRWVLDELLLRAACSAGAMLRRRSRCEAIGPSSPSPGTPGEGGGEGEFDRPKVVVRRLSDNSIESWESDWVLLADGKGALLGNRRQPTGDLGVKAHFAGVGGRRDTVELFGVHGHYVGVAAIEAGRWNLAMSVPAALLHSWRGNLDALFSRVLTQNPVLACRFAPAHRLTPWQVAPLPRFAVARSWPPRIIPLGNAAAALEPIGGEGIGLALRSAELAAEALTGGMDIAALPKAFNDLWQTRRLACRAAAWIVSRPRLAGPAVEWAAASPHLTNSALGWIGKRG